VHGNRHGYVSDKRERVMITQQRPYILEAKTQAFIDALGAQEGKPIYELSYGEAR
jgi:hypothetical protein